MLSRREFMARSALLAGAGLVPWELAAQSPAPHYTETLRQFWTREMGTPVESSGSVLDCITFDCCLAYAVAEQLGGCCNPRFMPTEAYVICFTQEYLFYGVDPYMDRILNVVTEAGLPSQGLVVLPSLTWEKAEFGRLVSELVIGRPGKGCGRPWILHGRLG